MQKQKGGEILAAAEPLAKAVYVLNYLRLTGDREEPPVIFVMMDACVFVNYSYNKTARRGQNVNATSIVYHNATAWCNYTALNASRSSVAPLTLPPGVFLICGDRAWGGVPSKLNGGPCSLKHLTLLTPNISMILTMTRKHKRVQRTVHQFSSSCCDNIEFWNPGEIIPASVLAPGVGVANALTT